MDLACAEVDGRAEPSALMDAPSDAHSGFENCDVEACCGEQPGGAKATYSGAKDTYPCRPALMIARRNGHFPGLQASPRRG